MIYVVLYLLAGVAWSLYLHKRHKNVWRRALTFAVIVLTWPFAILLDYDVYLDPKNDYYAERDREKISLVQEQNAIRVLILREYELTWDKILEKLGLSSNG